MARSDSSALRRELEQAIQGGRCAYCRRPGSAQSPLTREHVIPRAKGGGRKDVRIIVPACARCNHRRGCRELVLFLLLRPRRISAFLDYLSSLSPESVRQLDPRVLAEVYAAVWILTESARQGAAWRTHLRRVCSGRTLHRRRYAARRMVGGADVARHEPGESAPEEPDPLVAAATLETQLDESMDALTGRLVALLSLAGRIAPEEVRRQMTRQQEHARRPVREGDEEGVVRLDGWRQRHRRRTRVDRRGGRRPQRRGRAA